MATNSFGNRNFMQPMRGLSQGELKGARICGLDFLGFSVPNVFSSSSQHVFKVLNIFLNMFLNMFPVAPHFVPLSFWNLYKWMNVGTHRFVCLV